MEHNSEAKKTIHQVLKFAVVGVLNTLVDFAVFQTLNLTLGWVYAAQVAGYTFGVINSYLWNSNWTFPRTAYALFARDCAVYCGQSGVDGRVPRGHLALPRCVWHHQRMG